MEKVEAAAHALGEPTRDCQTEPAATVPPRRRTVRLLELFEDCSAARARHTRPGVDHVETQAVCPRTQDAQSYAARLRELDRVAGKVEQDLAQAHGVADDAAWHAAGHGAGDLQALALGSGRQQFDDALDQREEVEGLAREVEPARLDLGEIEDLVDKRRQRAAGTADGGDIGRLLRIERGAGEQFGHAEDAVERRAHLVAHGGEKARLRFVGGLRPVAGRRRLAQFPDFVVQAVGFALKAMAMTHRSARQRRGKSDRGEQRKRDRGNAELPGHIMLPSPVTP